MESARALGEKYFSVRADKSGIDANSLDRPVVNTSAPSCSRCGDLGYTVPDLDPGDPGFGRVIPCSCQEAIIAQALWRVSGLEPNEQSWEIDYVKGMPGKDLALTSVKLVCYHRSGWVILHGNYGVGKSGLLKSAVAHMVRSGQKAYYRRADDILAEARATFSASQDKDESDLKILEKYANVDILAIDEVDRFNVKSEWGQSFMFNLLDRRYNRRNEAVTLLATNMDIREMAEPWGYLQSRMTDGLVIGVDGRSLRDIDK